MSASRTASPLANALHALTLPAARRMIRQAHRRRTLGAALRRLARLAEPEFAERTLLEDLVYGWGNESFSAGPEYLRRAMQLVAGAGGPVLECGSGLSTLLTGIVAHRTGVTVWSLEHSADWHAWVGSELERHRIGGVELLYAPLRDYGEFSWYDPPPDRLPGGIRAVLCDGPPGTTPGGRYGLLPVLRPLLAPGCVVLLDDADRDGEREALRRWTEEAGAEVTFDDGGGKPFALARLPRVN
jgi:hypothetical protein